MNADAFKENRDYHYYNIISRLKLYEPSAFNEMYSRVSNELLMQDWRRMFCVGSIKSQSCFWFFWIPVYRFRGSGSGWVTLEQLRSNSLHTCLTEFLQLLSVIPPRWLNLVQWRFPSFYPRPDSDCIVQVSPTIAKQMFNLSDKAVSFIELPQLYLEDIQSSRVIFFS